MKTLQVTPTYLPRIIMHGQLSRLSASALNCVEFSLQTFARVALRYVHVLGVNQPSHIIVSLCNNEVKLIKKTFGMPIAMLMSMKIVHTHVRT